MHFSIQKQTLEKAIIECAENANHRDNRNQSTPKNNISQEKAAPTLNPFITDIDASIANDEQSPAEQRPVVPNVQISNKTVSSPITINARPQLPPIPPRQRSIEPIRIPMHLVQPKKAADVVDNNNSNSMYPITSNSMQSKAVPDIYKTSQQNGNGNSDHNTIELNNHDNPCPCKSGAHPKQPNKCQENGYHRAIPAPNLGKSKLILNFECSYVIVVCHFHSYEFCVCICRMAQTVTESHRKVKKLL